LFPEGTERVAGGGAKRHPRIAVQKTAHPAEGWQRICSPGGLWHALPGCRTGGAAFRRCRFAQPSATFWDASGIGSMPRTRGPLAFFANFPLTESGLPVSSAEGAGQERRTQIGTPFQGSPLNLRAFPALPRAGISWALGPQTDRKEALIKCHSGQGPLWEPSQGRSEGRGAGIHARGRTLPGSFASAPRHPEELRGRRLVSDSSMRM
jgi:hypothetical protein